MSTSSSLPSSEPRVYGEVTSTDYVLLSPCGDIVKLDKETFDALAMFVGKGKPAGQIQIDCNRGAIAGVKVTSKLK